MAAACFAAGQGLSTVQVGMGGQLGFASGLIDLLGVSAPSGEEPVRNPWEAMGRLVEKEPGHPYARLSPRDIETALSAVFSFLEENGYPHHHESRKNLFLPTPAGTLKPTYAVPHTMAPCAEAVSRKAPALLIDFAGMKGFSARQVAENLKEAWPDLRTVRLSFPESTGELYAESLARSLDVKNNRGKLADLIRPHLGGEKMLGVPAVLGVHRTLSAVRDLEEALGLTVFETPAMLPAVPGLRLREILEKELSKKGAEIRHGQRVSEAKRAENGDWLFTVLSGSGRYRFVSRTALLCTGRFFGKGLVGDRHGIRESLFGLPVSEPEGRMRWHSRNLFASEGHAVNRAGIMVDADFRPVDADGIPVYPNLFAAGTILSGQDWAREKSGSGLSIATAYGAVRGAGRCLGAGSFDS